MNLEKLMSIQKNLIPIRKSQTLTVSLLFSLKADYLEKFIKGNIGLNYVDFVSAKNCAIKKVANFKKLAQQGHALAQFHLIDMYSKGEGVKKARDKANYWYEKYKENL